MSQLVRSLVAMLAAVMVFGLALWLFQAAPFGWLPRAEADRWVVAAAFASVVAGAVFAALGPWVTDGETSPSNGSAKKVRQRAKADGNARVLQIGGDRGTRPDGRVSGGDTSARVDLRAQASGSAQVTQIGGDEYSAGSEPDVR